MFGRDEVIERIRAALVATDCDLNAFRNWQKQYEKMNKQKQAVGERYKSAAVATRRINEIAGQMEQMIVSGAAVDNKMFSQLLKELKHLQNSFSHEFLISKEDREFHSTFDTILRLGTKALATPDQKLILQSEIENLLALLKENLAKEEPDLKKLSFFYLSGTDQELAELPPAERLAKIEKLYDEEFEQPFITLLSQAHQRADERAERLEAGADRRSKKAFEAIQVLLEGEREPQKRAKNLLNSLMEA